MLGFKALAPYSVTSPIVYVDVTFDNTGTDSMGSMNIMGL